MNDVIINKLNGGLGRREPAADMVSGLIANGIAIVGGVQLAEGYRLKGIKDALAIGITEAYDTAHTILVYEHISEFFRINPNGDLHIMLVDQSVGFDTMLDPAQAYAKKLLVEAAGEIKQLAVAYNPTSSNVLFSETLLAIAKAQVLADEEYTQHRPVHILIEGRGFDDNALTNLRGLNAKSVSVMVGQSLEVVARNSAWEHYAAVGTLLGAVSKAAVNENVAWVEKFNMYGGSLSVPGINNKKLSDITEGVKESINDSGALFFRTHIGRAGIYFNDSHTCTLLTDDFAYIENNRTIDKAVRAIRAALLPRLNSPVLVDPETGKLNAGVVKSYENDGRRALEQMLNNTEVSGIDIFVDPNQNILSTSELLVEFEIIPTGTNRKIKVTIGFSNPF